MNTLSNQVLVVDATLLSQLNKMQCWLALIVAAVDAAGRGLVGMTRRPGNRRYKYNRHMECGNVWPVLADTWGRRGVVRRARVLFVQYAGADERVRDRVGVAVGRRPAVLQVSLLFFGHCAWYPDAACAVCNACNRM